MRRPRFQSPSVGAALIGAVAFALLLHANPRPPLTYDGVRDQLYVRDCVELARCHDAGAPTSVAGILQGAGWIDWLAGVRMLGGDVPMERGATLGLNALGIALLFFVAARWFGFSIGFWSSGLALAFLMRDGVLGQLVNPNGVFLPSTLCCVSLHLFVLTGRSRWLAAAAFFLGIAADMHVAAAALVPSLLMITILAGARPALDLMGAALVLVGTTFSTSWGAWSANVRFLGEHVPAGWCLLGMAGALGVVWEARPWFRSLSSGARAAATGIVMVTPFAVGTFILMRVLHHTFGLTYVYPILAPLTVLAIGFVHKVSGARAWVTAAIGLIASVLLLNPSWHNPMGDFRHVDTPPTASLADFRSNTGWMIAHGWSRARVLPPEAEHGFTAFMHRVQQGALGPGIVNANITLEKSEARLQLVLRDGTRHLFRIRPADGSSGREFMVVPENAASEGDVRPVGELLDQCFSSDPFVVAMGETPITAGDTSAFERSLRPITPRRLALVLIVQLLVGLLCVIALWREKAPGAGLSTDTR